MFDFLQNRNRIKAILRTVEFAIGMLFLGWSPGIILFGLYIDFLLQGPFEIIQIALSADKNKLQNIFGDLFIRGIMLFVYAIFFVIIDMFLNQTQGVVVQIALRLREYYWNPNYSNNFTAHLISATLVTFFNYLFIFFMNYKKINNQPLNTEVFSKANYHIHFTLFFGFFICLVFFITNKSIVLKTWPLFLIGVTFFIEMAFAGGKKKDGATVTSSF